MSTSPLPEPLDDFLNRPPSLPVDEALKQSLFQQTVPMPPQARRWHVLLAATAAGMVLALVTSYVAFRAGQDAVVSSATHEQPGQIAAAATVKAEHEPEIEPAPVLTAVQPQDLEWRAFDANDDQERARLYFQAGDLYLGTEQDIDAALRCYREALACSDARELRFDPRDNWLVMALKNDLRKEP